MLSITSYGQRVCGTPSSDSRTTFPNERSFTSHTFRVQYHILAKNNGSNPTTNINEIITAHNALNARFISSNICFAFSGYDVVENTNLRKWKVLNNSHIVPLIDELFTQNVSSSAINIYIIDADEDKESQKIQNGQLSPNYSTPEGAAEGIISHSLFIKQEKFTSEILAHEIGHVLGLFHTFEESSNGIDDGNCTVCGDLVNDTPPQPIACLPLDANCNLPYILPYNTAVLESNVMNYADNLSCLNTFTAGQQNRMHSIIDNTQDLLQRLITPNRTIIAQDIPYTIAQFFVINDVVQEAKGNLTLQDVNIQAPGKGAFRAEEEIIVLPGFDALEGSRVLLIIENICKENETQAKSVEDIIDYYENDGTRLDMKSEKLEVSEDLVLLEQVNGDRLTIYPNPTSSEFQIIYKTETKYEDDSKVSLEVLDLQGHQVILFASNYLNISRGESINVANLDSGLYFVVLRIGSEQVISRLIKQ